MFNSASDELRCTQHHSALVGQSPGLQKVLRSQSASSVESASYFSMSKGLLCGGVGSSDPLHAELSPPFRKDLHVEAVRMYSGCTHGAALLIS